MDGQQSPEVPGLVDAVTGLPWSTALHAEAARLALEHDLHAVSLHLAGLSSVMETYGGQTFVSLLRDITRHLRALLDSRDRLSRHAADRLLLVTVRPPEGVARLADAMVAGIIAAAVEVEGERLPRVYLGMARLPQVADPSQAADALDGAILSAELAASASRGVRAVEVARPPSPPEPRAEGPVVPEAYREGVPGERQAPRGERLTLKGLRLDLSGLVATAVVELTYRDRHADARSVGRNVEERRLFLIGEATARAATDFLPPGHGAVIHDVTLVQPGAAELGHGVLATVLFLEPDKEQFLFGVAPADGDVRLAAARAVLAAVNRRIGPLLPRDR